MNKNGKIAYIDGLRTVFCIIVIVHHFMLAFYPKFPLIIYNDGNLSVIFFMILSGLVLPLGVFSKEKNIESIKEFVKEMYQYAVKRYLRLLPVIAMTILISYLLLRFGCYKTQEVAEVYNLDIIGSYFNSDVNFLTAVFDAFVGSFFRRPILNTPLWTIKYEFLGAIVTYGMVLLFKNNKYRYLIYGMVCGGYYLYTHDIYFPCIVVGMVMADCFYRKDISSSKICLKPSAKILLAIFLALAYVPVVLEIYPKCFRMFFAVGSIFLLMVSNTLKTIFSSEFLVRISKCSYEIYAVHWLVIGSVACSLMAMCKDINYYVATTFVFIITVFVTFLMAYASRTIVKKWNGVYWQKGIDQKLMKDY